MPTATKSSSRLAWYLRRLRVMGGAEIAHRVAEQLTLVALRFESALAPGKPPRVASGFLAATGPCLPLPPLLAETDAARVQQLLDGRLTALGHAWQWRDGAASWRVAPDTGRLWPTGFFASIAYRAGNPFGDIRVAWEPARLQHLFDLAVTGTPEAARVVAAQLVSFVDENPPYRGIHYVSAMECALRIIAVCHALDRLRAHLAPDSPAALACVALVDSHARLIERRLSLYSSAGNHTVAEAAGLVYAGCLFPELPGAQRWQRQGTALLAMELDRQVLPDGGGLEQTFWYLRFITELGALVAALLESRGEPVPQRVKQAVERALGFLGAVADPDGSLPAVGDSDDGYALSRRLRLHRPAAVHPDAGGRVSRSFREAGYTLLQVPGGGGVRLLFDHGALGMAPAFGHGHADALAVRLAVGGAEILVDTGTCTYTGHIMWRGHFRSTAAHNTVTIDGNDQATQETPFMWSAPFRAELVRIEESAGGCRVLARHDGYAGTAGAVHWRGVALRADGSLLVWDQVTGSGRHAAVLRWHVAGEVREGDGRYRLETGQVLEIQRAHCVGSIRGGEQPPKGWRSTSYGSRQPICVIEAQSDGNLPCQFITQLWPADTPGSDAVMQDDLETFRQWLA